MSQLSIIINFILNKNVPIWSKLWLIFPILYIISPIDFIPFQVIGLSVIDDLIVFLLTICILKDQIKKYNNVSDKNNNSKRKNNSYKKDSDLKDKTIIENVEYEVKDNYDKGDF